MLFIFWNILKYILILNAAINIFIGYSLYIETLTWLISIWFRWKQIHLDNLLHTNLNFMNFKLLKMCTKRQFSFKTYLLIKQNNMIGHELVQLKFRTIIFKLSMNKMKGYILDSIITYHNLDQVRWQHYTVALWCL